MNFSLLIGFLGLILIKWVDGGTNHTSTDAMVELTLVQSAVAKGAGKYIYKYIYLHFIIVYYFPSLLATFCFESFLSCIHRRDFFFFK